MRIEQQHFFISDEHYGHENIIKYTSRPFENVEEMNEEMIKRNNEIVGPNDIVVHAGDFCWAKTYQEAQKYIDRLNGNHIFLLGSHDKWLKGKSRWQVVWERMIEGQFIVVCHYCMRTWARSHFNSWHLYGHCLDANTEILTKTGWRFRKDLNIDDEVVTLNMSSGLLEYNEICEIVDYPHYYGNMYSLISKGVDLRVTANHTMLDIKRGSDSSCIRKFHAHDIANLERRIFIKAGILPNKGVNINSDYIRLLVWIAADGSLANSNLARIKVFRHRKKERIKWLLNRLNILYTDNTHKDSGVCYNFQIPEALCGYRFKPIDNIILKFNRSQIRTMLSEYIHTDGHLYGKSTAIWTSKREEADIIQAASVTNGFTCNISSRINHGFSKNPSYTLIITDRTERIHANLKERVIVESVLNEPVWCVKTKNKTIMIRRNGKPIIVGNSHGRLDPIGKSWDIGVDNNNFYPISFDKVSKIMEDRPDNPNLVKHKHRH